MAIKSKGRPRGRRAVSAAPRRPLVVRKPPIWRRPWVWVVVGLMAAGGITFGILSVLHSHQVKARTARERLAVTNLFIRIRGALPTDFQTVPPDVWVIFPSVNTDLPKIGTDITGDAAVTRGKAIAAQALTSYNALQALPVSRIIPAEFSEDRTTVTNSLFLMSRAIQLYQEVGGIIQGSANLSGDDLKTLIDQATQLTRQAGTLFDQGYRQLLHIADRLNIPQRVQFAPPTSPPAPSPSPSTSPSVSPSASSSATPSATPTGGASASPSTSPSG